MLLPIGALSQTENTLAQAALKADGEAEPALTIEQAEDTTKIRTIDDVVNDKVRQARISGDTEHWDDVWSRRSYFNLGYNMSTLAPTDNYRTGIGNEMVNDFKSDYGFSLQYGRSFRLHKKPIANILQFCIDYTGIDLNFSHYASGAKADGANLNLYNSNAHNMDAKSNEKKSTIPFYIPWNLEKFEGSYGMMLGPSLTVAPFTYLSNRGLHYLKLNVYFHIGYQASILYMKDKEMGDVNYEQYLTIDQYLQEHSWDRSSLSDTQNQIYNDHSNIQDVLKLNWGHGMLTTFGLSLTWKSIGIGYEHRVAHNKYKSFSTGDDEFGSASYNFKTTTDRVFITFRMGR